MGLLRTALLVVITAVLINVLPSLFRKRAPVHVTGFTAPGWELVEQAFRKNIESGLDIGGGFSVYHKGELVVDLGGGYADSQAEWPWNKDTLTCVYSSTKGVAALMVAMLVDRGLLDYDQPVSRYWPGFGQNGKDKITVRQLMSHRAGIPVIDEPFLATDILYHPEKVLKIIEQQKPIWEPGTKHGYHGLTIGLYADNLIQKVDPKHRNIQQFMKEELQDQFGVDFHIGLPSDQYYRCARLYPMSPLQMLDLSVVDYHSFKLFFKIFTQPSSLISKSLMNPTGLNLLNPEHRRVPCTAFSGYGSAHGLAKVYSILANGGTFDKQRLLSRKAINDMISQPTTELDQLLDIDVTWVAGMIEKPSPVGTNMYGTLGSGGQMGFADLDNQLGLAYITNDLKLAPLGRDPRYTALEETVYKSLTNLK